MRILVQKFGGTSVADIDRLKMVRGKVKAALDQGYKVVVVLSAKSGKTNKLLDLSTRWAAEPDLAEVDSLLSTGEQASVALFSMLLKDSGIKARSMLGWQIPIITNDEFGRARILSIDASRIRKEFETHDVLVVAGFQGTTEDGRITTLGRGGSDTSAVALAAALDSCECEIYTDVDGVYTTDPNLCSTARKLDRVTYEEMLEMASMGAKVLQIRSVEFAKKYNVPVHVRSTFSDDPGTLVAQEDAVVGGVEADTVIGHAVLGLVVGTNLLGTVAVADLALALGTELSLLLLELHLVQTSAQHLHADFAVLDLGALFLRLHHGVGGQVGDAHGGISGVNALTARTGGAVGVDAQVGLVDLDVDLLGLGKYGDGRRGGLDTALGLGLGNALDAVHAGLELHDGVDAVALDLELDGLKAAGLAGAGIEHGGLPAARLAEALVHLVQIAGKDGRLVATGGGTDLDDGVLVVVGVARDEHVLNVFLELGKLGLVFGDVHLEHLFLIGIGGIVEHFLGGLDVIERADVLTRGGDEVGLVCVLLVETRELLDIGGDGWVGKLLLELLVGLDDLFELVAHDGLLLYA